MCCFSELFVSSEFFITDKTYKYFVIEIFPCNELPFCAFSPAFKIESVHWTSYWWSSGCLCCFNKFMKFTYDVIFYVAFGTIRAVSLFTGVRRVICILKNENHIVPHINVFNHRSYRLCGCVLYALLESLCLLTLPHRSHTYPLNTCVLS